MDPVTIGLIVSTTIAAISEILAILPIPVNGIVQGILYGIIVGVKNLTTPPVPHS